MRIARSFGTRSKLVPDGERQPSATDCYRFVFSHPDVNVRITGPSSEEQMEDDLEAPTAGPPDEKEMERVRRIGMYIDTSKVNPPLAAR